MSTEQYVKRLIEERARTREEQKALYDAADKEGRDLTAEERQKDDRLNAALDDFDARIPAMVSRLEKDRMAEEARSRVEGVIRPAEDRSPMHDEAARLRAWATGDPSTPNGIEVNLSGLRTERAYKDGPLIVRDDLTEGSAAGGGNTVPTSFRRQLYEHLIENSAIRQTNVTVLTTSTGEPLILPKTTAHTSAGTIVSEGATINAVDPTFGQATLNSYGYKKLVYVSSELLRDTAVDVVGYLARSFGEALANGSGADFVVGSGSNKPMGFITAGSLMVTGATGNAGAPTSDEVIDLYFSVAEPYARNGWWVARRATIGQIRKLKDANNQYLWQPGLAGSVPNTILDRPYVMDPNVPAAATSATSLAFGDFSRYVIRDVGRLRFERSDDFAFDNDLVTYRVILFTDGDLLDTTGSIGLFKGGTA